MDRQEPSPVAPPQIPVRLQRYEETTTPPHRKFWLHPKSGLLILAVDWFFFAPEAFTAEAAAIITCPLAFIITGLGVFWIQRRKNGDSFAAAALKAFLGGVVAGIPTSIGGTILGTLVLVLSGRSNWNRGATARNR
jgi:RsiW-degrading membrane proteinase PrsW (M82 family)